MVYQRQHSAYERLLELSSQEGFDGFKEIFSLLMNAAMVLEREKHLGASSYERSDNRRGYANGYKPKTVRTRMGQVELRVPQTRDAKFYPQSLEKGRRSERALGLAIAEMYVQGVSTRKVATITEQLCGFGISTSTVSKLTSEIDTVLREWRERPLGNYEYVHLDARYEKVRHGGLVIDSAVLIAAGVDEQGKREILGVSVALSEAELHWRNFLFELQKRGLHGVKLFISDDHAGLKAARAAVFPGVPWQRCQFHLQQNAQKYVPRQSMKKLVASDIRAIFAAPDRDTANRLLAKTIARYERPAPQLAAWMENNLPEGLAFFNFPSKHRMKIRTTNILERLNREIKRRTQVASIFPNTESCLRLVTAVVMEISEEWLTQPQRYMPQIKEQTEEGG